ncbi:MAG: type VI secretion system baseplate subunit TssG [Deltaproteobacteria bacterium]|nr:type VI secretion system baseplate subunit TssG [Deltaproteobacteria bacterium]
MGPEERQRDADLSPAQVEQALAAYGTVARRFSFYRLLYLLERLFPRTPRLGYTGPAREERIRLRAAPSLVFASSDVSELGYRPLADGVRRAQVSVAFLGLYGSASPLPTHFVEEISLSVHQGGPQPVRELLDVLHHRLLTLCYRAWAKYRLSVGYLRDGHDTFTRRMFCAVGLDGFGKGKTLINPFYFLKFAPLLASKSRSARGLQVVLDELLDGIGVQIEQFVGHWTLIEKPVRNKLGVANHQLGEDLVIGRYVYDGSGRYTVVLGPLQYDDYLSFLPGGHRRPFLQSVINTFTPGIHDVMLELHVDLEAAPRFQLASPRAATLSRTAWLGGSAAGIFEITVPLEDAPPPAGPEEEEEDRGEPPPLP